MENNAKWRQKNAADSIINVDQTKGFILFIYSKVAVEYKTIFKDFILSFALTI